MASLRNMKSDDQMMNLRKKVVKLHIKFDDIVSATNNFADDNLIKRGSIGDVHKGKLRSNEHSDVVIRRFRPSSGIRYFEFLKEMATLSCLNHTNILSFVGFCDDNLEMMLVFKYEDNGSLDRYLSDPNLTWSQKWKICVGAANALRYIHKVIERHLYHGFSQDIKSTKILLNKDWEAKLFCFGFHIGSNNKKNDIIHIEINNDVAIRSPSHVSYSFGVILFEVLFERKAHMGDDESLVSVATRLYEEGKLEDMINPDLRKQMHRLSLPLFSQLAYGCVKKSPPYGSDRGKI
ncbi:probable receptor-like protein kinase At2g23200 [Rutidosis leptorrhynchoides]|uniref:probable receptor-like protein kinase At2g23200 n=1 Tax=Rutidosis leptorrhynchoides TaxID=125765 RepID=UPI003A99FA4B